MVLQRPAHAIKAEIVLAIAGKLKSPGVAVAEYKNLTVAQMTKFRQAALKQNIEVKVYKDSLVRRAAEASGLEGLSEFLTQQNVFIFSEDSIAAAKLVAEFAKTNEDMKLKAGIIEGAIMDTAAINEIASLPSKDELYGMFASSLIYPLRQFMNVVKEIAKTKEA
ncbi:50S ribosomal protein L10 [Williamsoniiplasma somnilux]|uniref:Large ribosomal subunit protein uL10 n=1 Tax=Williamsoniiplasma somnilux TaxID=215578 RepID=A0A2K8NZU3_9MOLU|nr:50S ribosomal protein L10 [Williamsoniiplasma somnilux]ATZ19066.1 50S ribosomal protein L10 [Williamsoniiplasma somnilux]